MSECRKIIRRIQDAENGFDRNILEHCRNCPGCRRELAAKLAAENPGGIEPAARLDRATLAACRNGRLRKFRHRLVRGLGWGAAAAAAACGLLLGIPRPAAPEFRPEFSGVEGEASELAAELADIDASLLLIQQRVAGDETAADKEYSI